MTNNALLVVILIFLLGTASIFFILNTEAEATNEKTYSGFKISETEVQPDGRD